MYTFLHKALVLIAVFFCVALGGVQANTLEKEIIKRTLGDNREGVGLDRFNTLLGFVIKDEYEKVLAFLKEILGAHFSSKEAAALCKMPLSNSTIKDSYNLNLLQYAIKNQAVDVVHALLLLQTVEDDVNSMGNTQKADTDLLMLAVDNMQNEKGLKILAMLVAAGVTCDNSKYPYGSETPLTKLVKQKQLSEVGELGGLMRKGILVLINAGFDPYEERHKSESPFIQVVAKRYNAIIATSAACFGEKHKNDTALVKDATFQGIVNEHLSQALYLKTTDSYKSIIEEASGSLKDAEEIMEGIRVELLKHRKGIVKYFIDNNWGNILEESIFTNDAYVRLMPKRKQDLFKQSIDELETIKKQVEGAANAFNRSSDYEKENVVSRLGKEISRRNALLGQEVDAQAINYRRLQDKAKFSNPKLMIYDISYTEAVDLAKEAAAPEKGINRLEALHGITAELGKNAQECIDDWKKGSEEEIGSVSAPQPSNTPQQASGESDSQSGENSQRRNDSQPHNSPGQALSTTAPPRLDPPQVPGGKNSSPVSPPVTQHKDGTVGEDSLTRRSFAQYAGIGLAVGGVALMLFLLMKKLRSQEDNESEDGNEKAQQKHVHNKQVFSS